MASAEVEEKYNANAEPHKNEKSVSLSDDDEVVFGGQVPRTVRQVTGITNLEKAKTLMTLSTAGVRTSVVATNNPNIGKSDYVPNPDLFNFSNPSRPADDLGGNRASVSRQPSQPTFSAPTAARSPGTITARYTRNMTWRGDDNQELLFGKFVKKGSCYFLLYSAFLAVIFGYFYPAFGEASCESVCVYTEVPSGAIHGVINDAVTMVSGCETQWVMYSLTTDTANSVNATLNNGTMIDFDDLSDLWTADDIESMWIGATNWNQEAKNCWENQIKNGETLAGYVEFTNEDGEYYWDFGAAGWFMIVSMIMAMVFIFNEWLFYSYNEIWIPGTDHRAYIWWYLLRIAWFSYMFTVIMAHSLLVNDDLSFLIGMFGYEWLQADGIIATAFVGLWLLVCFCCCCLNENDSWDGNACASSGGQYGCEKYFLVQSRMDLDVVHQFEKSIGIAMCASMVFVFGWLLCGFIPFTEFLVAGLLSSMQFPYFVALFALTIIVITIQMIWFARAKCCGDEDDKRKVAEHNQQVQQVRRARSAPSVTRSSSNNLR